MRIASPSNSVWRIIDAARGCFMAFGAVRRARMKHTLRRPTKTRFDRLRGKPAVCCGDDVRFRRLSPVAAGPGEGLLTEPTADARACRWELVKMPRSSP